ncbi:nucleotide modification associated domain-containing protein [Ruminococcus sp.]|uniref:nucleotide modification associated domain-containing protein n=1 Tax=Ruminococcus sp. TaxID=41978 RepID=UPI003F0C4D0A
MEYHKIGERFEYDGVMLEVVEWSENDGCDGCYFCNDYSCPDWCREETKFVLIEQCKTKDMEHKEVIEERSDERIALRDKETGRLIYMKGKFNNGDIYESYLNKLFETYKAKDKDYGSAFSEMFDELGIDYAYGKLREKINRIKVLRKQPNMVENEGLEDALLDTAGYAILTLVELRKRNNDTH